jgi:SAM-dependent methyltransferase
MSPGELLAVQRFWDRRPCNLRHSPAAIGSRRYFEEVARRKYFVESHIPGFSEFKKWRNRKVLEVGCGIGTAAASFAQAGALYTGVDLSPESLKIARQRFRVLGLTGSFHQADAEHLSAVLPRQTFDLVYSFGVLHHTPRPDRAVAQIRRYLGPRSEFRLMLYAKNSWKNFMIEAGLDRPEAQAGCPIAYTYTPEEARQLLRGFTILEMRQAHIFPFEINAYKRYRYRLQPWFAAMPPKMFAKLEERLGWHLLIRCRKKPR